jgi:hypothetical protein
MYKSNQYSINTSRSVWNQLQAECLKALPVNIKLLYKFWNRNVVDIQECTS